MNEQQTPTSFLSDEFMRHSNTGIHWESQIAARPYTISDDEQAGCAQRYDTIKSFQQKAMDVFRASLNGDIDPAIAQTVIGDVPASLGREFHQALPSHLWETPAFFRTDEAELGLLTEVQCSGSGWDLAQALFELYQQRPDIYGEPVRGDKSLAARVGDTLKNQFGPEPVVHHLTDNASRPHGIRYFINKVRAQGVRYLHHDDGVGADDCQFVRSHDFFSLPYHNFYDRRVELSSEGKVRFDLPPIALFDSKMIMAWPFWSKTREYFDDAERAIFPFTTVVTANGMEWEDGTLMPIDVFSETPQSQRKYFLKYAGTDVGLNWGSKAVFSTHSMSRINCAERLTAAAADFTRGKPWILQRSVLKKETIDVLDDTGGNSEEMEGYGKWSNFYGPDGHLGQLIMHKNAHKVHGSDETVMSIVY